MAHRIFTSSFLFSLILLLVLFAGCRDGRTDRRSIGMQAMADTLVVPDLMVWTITMKDSDPQLPAAKAANDAKLKAVMDAIAQVAAIPGSVSRGPARIERRFERCREGKARVSRFLVSRVVTFRQGDPEAADKTLDRLVKAADIEVSSYFMVSEREKIMRRLRLQAMDQARYKAQSLAAHAGLGLGEFLGVSVNENLDRFRENRNGTRAPGVSGPETKYLCTKVNVRYAIH